MDNIKQWFAERKTIYYILSLFYNGRVDEGFELLRKSNLLQNFVDHSDNTLLSNIAGEVIKEINESDSNYKQIILEDHQKLFIGPDELLAPLWESVYKTKDKLLFGEIEAEVRRFYNSIGLDIKANEPADYLPLELSFMSRLCSINEKENLENINNKDMTENLTKQINFINKHLLSWLSFWIEDVNKNASVKFWIVFAEMTKIWIENDLAELEKLYDYMFLAQ